MKTKAIPLKINPECPYEGNTDTKIRIEGQELARVVGNYVEATYGVDAQAVVFEMSSEFFQPSTTVARAIVDVRKKDGAPGRNRTDVP